MSIIINAQELKEKIENDNVAIIDVRTKGGEFETGKAAYEHSHLPGALYLDMEKDVAGQNGFMPEADKLADKLGSLGIDRNTPVVLYDDSNHRAASKSWFVLHYLGHEAAYVLDGGFRAWIEAGYEVTENIPTTIPTTYKAKLKKELVVDIDEMKRKLNEENSALIDSRSRDRYIGRNEPKYKKAGHIPGAKNYHAKQVFNREGRWKTEAKLKRIFSDLRDTDEIVVSCGSGNSACMNAVALKEAGFQNVKLFPGGF